MAKIVTFGEIMLRLAPPNLERPMQSPKFVATFGGGEANVAVSTSNFGLPSSFVTALPDHFIADACLAQLRGFGIDVSQTIRTSGRLGVYFLEHGANQRPSKVIYDRDDSAIALAKPGDFDWDAIFDGATWFHITGITPAISAAAAELWPEGSSKHGDCRGRRVARRLPFAPGAGRPQYHRRDDAAGRRGRRRGRRSRAARTGHPQPRHQRPGRDASWR